jgi:hypothetical protein
MNPTWLDTHWKYAIPDNFYIEIDGNHNYASHAWFFNCEINGETIADEYVSIVFAGPYPR